MCFHNQIWIVFTLFLSWFLLKLPMIDKELLPYVHLICHTHCQKIGKFEWAGSHPFKQIYSKLCKTRNQKKWIVIPIGNKKNNLNTLPVGICVLELDLDCVHVTFFLVSVETTNDWLEKENTMFSSNREYKKNNSNTIHTSSRLVWYVMGIVGKWDDKVIQFFRYVTPIVRK